MKIKIIDTIENSIDKIFEKYKYEKCIEIEPLPKEIDPIEVCTPLVVSGTFNMINVDENNDNQPHSVSMQPITGHPIRFKLELYKFEEDHLAPPEDITKNWEVKDE